MQDAKIALGKNGFWNGKKHARGQDAKLALSRDKSSFRTATIIWNSPPPLEKPGLGEHWMEE